MSVPSAKGELHCSCLRVTAVPSVRAPRDAADVLARPSRGLVKDVAVAVITGCSLDAQASAPLSMAAVEALESCCLAGQCS
jgi:hypothetical protein